MTHSAENAEQYPEEFRRDVADEAHYRTTDGFEALAGRRGLAVELVWAWHEEFHPAGPGPFDVMHCWAGTFQGDDTAFWAYVGEDPGGSGVSQLLADAGEDDEFDYDLLYAELFASIRPIEDLLRDATFSVSSAEVAALAAARAIGLLEGNALVCSGDPWLTIKPRNDFRGLRYLGVFGNRAT